MNYALILWRVIKLAELGCLNSPLWIFQGLPGVTLPGVTGERGLAGEKVSAALNLLHVLQNLDCVIVAMENNVCSLAGYQRRQRCCWCQRTDSECRPTHTHFTLVWQHTEITPSAQLGRIWWTRRARRRCESSFLSQVICMQKPGEKKVCL